MRRHERWVGWSSVTTAAVLMAAFGPVAVQAAPVNFSLAGSVTFADAGNGFGVSVGDSVSLTGTYDDSNYSGSGFGRVSFGEGTGNTLQISVGSVVLNEFNDVDFEDGDFPAIMFFDGSVVGTDIVMDLGVNGSPVNFNSNIVFEGIDENGLVIEGKWDLAAIQTGVPEPGSLTLAGTAALACGFFARRRKQSRVA